MSAIMINVSSYGLRVIGDEFEIVIDPSEDFGGSADAVLISDIHSSIYNHQCPVFVSESIKNLAFNTLWDDKYTVSCITGKKFAIRKNRKKLADCTFIKSDANPAKNAVVIETQNIVIAYTSAITSECEAIPDCDIRILNCHPPAPIMPLLRNIPEFTVHTDDYSKLYDILTRFNQGAPDNSVGIDRTVLDAACHYLKNDFTVFSKAIKPLSQFEKLPPVIITSEPSRYPSRPAIPGSLFYREITLGDIYKLSSSVNAKNIIAFCPGYEGERKRGNLTITGEDATYQI